MGDNRHHELGSTATNSHGVAALNFATVSGCYKSIVGPTLAHGGILDLLMTNVPDLIWVYTVLAPIGNSDRSSELMEILMQLLLQTCVLVRKFS